MTLPNLDGLPPEQRAAVAEHLGFLAQWRESLGLPPDGLPPSMAEIKNGERANIERVARTLLIGNAGRRTIDLDIGSAFFSGDRPVHDRDLPWFVYTLIMADAVAAEREPEWITWAWTKPEFPNLNLGTEPWLALFNRVGYVTDWDEPEPGEVDDEGEEIEPPPAKPTKPVILYRGVDYTLRGPREVALASRGMAWTDDLDRARWFAKRFGGGIVVTAKVNPKRVLARFIGRGESEYVIDTNRLQIRQHEIVKDES
jgi:hypothetical protein